MKKVSLVLFLSLIIFTFTTTIALADQSIKLMVNGQEIKSDIQPQVINGRTYFPVRVLANSLSVTDDNIWWDANAQTVTLMKGDTGIQMKIGDFKLFVNGKVTNMDVSPLVIQGRTMLPVSWLAGALGYTVGWDEGSQTININSNINSNNEQNVTAYKLTLDFSFGTREGEYTGSLVNGIPNGNGEFKSKNSSGLSWVYTGEFVNGHFNGSGRTVWEDGTKKEGTYENDQLINDLPEESSFKSKCVNIDNSFARNPDNYIEKAIKFTGKVVQVIEGKDNAVDYRISWNNNADSIFWASYVHKTGESRVLKDDKVEIWGIYKGSYTYKSIIGAEITIPNVSVQYLDIQGTYSSNPSSTTTQITTQTTTQTTSNSYLEQRKAQCLSELNNLATKLENVKNEKNTRIFQNGVWTYVADPQALANAQQAYDQKYAEYQRLLNQ